MITGLRRCKKRPSFNLPSNCIMIRNFCQAVLRRVFQFFQEFFYFPLFSAEVSFFRALPPENTDRVPPFRLLSALLPPAFGAPFPLPGENRPSARPDNFPGSGFFSGGRTRQRRKLPPPVFSLCGFPPGPLPCPLLFPAGRPRAAPGLLRSPAFSLCADPDDFSVRPGPVLSLSLNFSRVVDFFAILCYSI